MYTVSFLKNGFEGGCDYKVYLTSHIFCVKMQLAEHLSLQTWQIIRSSLRICSQTDWPMEQKLFNKPIMVHT